MRVSFSAFVLMASLAAAAPALAANASPPSSPEANTTVKAFGAWALHCQPAQEQGAEPLCVVAETIQAAGDKTIAVISIGHRHPGDPVNIVVTLPANVSFPSSVHIRTDESDKWGLELQWQRCMPGACIAGGVMSPAAVAHWSSLQSEGKIVFTDAGGDEVGVPMSLRGFGDAYKAFNN
jgi:invasion protein IalB